jgi:hypothetical protein
MLKSYTENQLNEVKYGIRDERFDTKIKDILKIGGLKDAIISKIYDENKSEWYKVFTHKSVDFDNNYEYYECLGDSVVNHSIIEILNYRFPHFNCTEGVRLITRLKINLVSKKVLSDFSKELGFWDFISATFEIKLTKMKPVLEDVFEGFMGLLSILMDRLCSKDKDNVQVGAGYRVCFNIIRNIISKYPICGNLPGENGVQIGLLDYNLCVDFKTQLKEIFDKRDINEKYGKLKYQSIRDNNFSHTSIKTTSGISLGTGIACLKPDSEQIAAKDALQFLKKYKIYTVMNDSYKKFCYLE